MDNRYEQQDRNVLGISHFISTFQLTLKAVGGKEPGSEDKGAAGGAATSTNAIWDLLNYLQRQESCKYRRGRQLIIAKDR